MWLLVLTVVITFSEISLAAPTCAEMINGIAESQIDSSQPEKAYHHNVDARPNGIDSQKWTNLILGHLSPTKLILLNQKLADEWNTGNLALRKTTDRVPSVQSLLNVINLLPDSINENDRISLAIGFQNIKTSQWEWIRPNIDPFPDSNLWKMGAYNELDDAYYSQLLARGIMPLSLKVFFHEVVGHYLVWYSNFEFMRVTRNYYRLKQQGSLSARPAHFDGLLFELLSLPDLSNQKAVESLFHGHLNLGRVISPKEIFESYGSFELQESKVKKLVEIGEGLILKLGGAIGDSSYINSLAEKAATHPNSSAEIGFRSIFLPTDFTGIHPMGRLPRHSLHYIWYQLTQLQILLYRERAQKIIDPKRNIFDSVTLEKMILGRMATIEAIFVNASFLQITPTSFIEQAAGIVDDTKLQLFISSYLKEPSIWLELLQHPK